MTALKARKSRAGARSYRNLLFLAALYASTCAAQATWQTAWFAPRAADFAAASQPLAPAITALCAATDGKAELAAARGHWLQALLAWERLSSIAVGPLLQQRLQRRLDFSPTRPRLIVKAVKAAPKTLADLEHIGTPAKGLPALAWLLWSEPVQPGSPECRYAALLASELETGAGLIGVRDAQTLEKLAEWPTFGVDPHEMVWDATHPERIFVANGGIPTRPESGRIKLDLAHMDSSLVCLDSRTSAGLGLWQWADPRLSLRHVAWHGNVLGIALQAEHDDPQAKAAAPVLARFDGRELRPVTAPRPLAGYAGSIVATAEGFAVSCPRAHGIARFSADGVWRGFVELEQACALATQAGTLIAGGSRAAYKPGSTVLPLVGMRLDNHWVTSHP